MKEHRYYVYTMASIARALYTGITNNLRRRAYEHRNDLIEGHTRKYRIHRLVHYEVFSNVRSAINREKQIKGWSRQKKLNLISADNTWEDLAAEWFDGSKLKLRTPDEKPRPPRRFGDPVNVVPLKRVDPKKQGAVIQRVFKRMNPEK